MTDSAKLPALAVTDRWMRGVRYARTFQLLEPDGTPVDFSELNAQQETLWSNWQARIEGSGGQSEVMIVRPDISAGVGFFSLFCDTTALERDWPQRGLGPRNQLLVSVRATYKAVYQPIMQLRLTVEDSAFG